MESKDVLFKGGPVPFVQEIKMNLEKKLLQSGLENNVI